MAKILVTVDLGSPGGPEKRIIDADVYEFRGRGRLTTAIRKGDFLMIKESIEEIYKLINEAEAQATNKKLDEILENQRKILDKLSDMDTEVISCEEF